MLVASRYSISPFFSKRKKLFHCLNMIQLIRIIRRVLIHLMLCFKIAAMNEIIIHGLDLVVSFTVYLPCAVYLQKKCVGNLLYEILCSLSDFFICPRLLSNKYDFSTLSCLVGPAEVDKFGFSLPKCLKLSSVYGIIQPNSSKLKARSMYTAYGRMVFELETSPLDAPKLCLVVGGET